MRYPLPAWYNRVIDKTVSELDELDVARMMRRMVRLRKSKSGGGETLVMHDNMICSYTVDLENGEITIIACDEEKKEKEIVHVTGVLTHSFEYALRYNIVFSIEQLPMEYFFTNNAEQIVEGKQYSWPIVYDSEKQLKKYLIDNEYKYIVLDSSYGMCGWVLAQKIEVHKEGWS